MSNNQKENGKYFPFSFYGNSREFFSIWIVNVFLCIITLGIYIAWALIKEWRYFYGNTELAGSRFELSATPSQILTFVLCAYGCLAMLLIPFINIMAMLVFVACIPLIIIKIIKFCMRSTRFRGHSFDFVCQGGEAYWACIGWPFLSLLIIMIPLGSVQISLGGGVEVLNSGFIMLAVFIIPLLIMRWAIQNYLYMKMIINNLVIGKGKFSSNFRKAAFIKFHFYAFLVTLPFNLIGITIVSLYFNDFIGLRMGIDAGDPLIQAGIILKLYSGMLFFLIGNYIASLLLRVWLTNYVCQSIVLDNDIRITSTMSHRSYLKLALLNLVMVIISFGLCIPHVRIRTARYLAECIAIEGDIDRILPLPEKATDSGISGQPESQLF